MAFPALTPITPGILHSKGIGTPDNGVNAIEHGLDPEMVLQFEDHLEIEVAALGATVEGASYVGLSADGSEVLISFVQTGADQAQVYFKVVWSGAW